MNNGKVKFFSTNRGFGFIKQDSGDDLFFHVSDTDGTTVLQENDEVEFEIGEGKKGPCAKNVRLKKE